MSIRKVHEIFTLILEILYTFLSSHPSSKSASGKYIVLYTRTRNLLYPGCITGIIYSEVNLLLIKSNNS